MGSMYPLAISLGANAALAVTRPEPGEAYAVAGAGVAQTDCVRSTRSSPSRSGQKTLVLLHNGAG